MGLVSVTSVNGVSAPSTPPAPSTSTPSAPSTVKVAFGGGWSINNVTEITVTCIFCLNLLLLLLTTDSLARFFTDPWNYVDVVGVVPFFLLVAFEINDPGSAVNIPARMTALTWLRFGRCLWLLKLARAYPPVIIMARVLVAQADTVLMLFLLGCFNLMWWGTIIYMCEAGNRLDYTFESIPTTMWFVLVTMTTVGYGDQVVQTPQGKAMTGLCMFSALLMLSLPIGVIGGAFSDEQKKYLAEQAAAKLQSAPVAQLEAAKPQEEQVVAVGKQGDAVEGLVLELMKEVRLLRAELAAQRKF